MEFIENRAYRQHKPAFSRHTSRKPAKSRTFKNFANRIANLSDAELEHAIHRSYYEMITATDIPGRVAAWSLMSRLIKHRSPESIARLERERRLVKPI